MTFSNSDFFSSIDRHSTSITNEIDSSQAVETSHQSSPRSSMQSIPVPTDERPVSTAMNVSSSSSKTSSSFLSKLTDAKKSIFGKTTTPEPTFSSATQNKALLTYILSEPDPQLDIIQEFERHGAQLNSVTDEGNTILHLLARAEIHSTESVSIVEYLIKKGGCDPNKQNDYGWTAGQFYSVHVFL